MKKAIMFAGIFIVAFMALQIVSGLLLTMAYTPNFMGAVAKSSQVDFGQMNIFSLLLIALLSSATAFVITKKWRTNL
ncbi:hypothetical protein [Bacillus sp. FJAT-50079]|uniref:hypothetical protein n=1 Tax=Bacillus sp. FJAT-50079 TaxID=2833577 RepID=UPI001BC9C3A6|nr:hypothetical protein [Bacillus sp. FJAT-50079]MBS4209399.1 hypothetical protein [Bacillus sp. FJAT-50079]